MENVLISLFLILVIFDTDFIGKGLFKFLPMLITATFAVILKLMVESKTKKITFWNALMSWIGAVGLSYIFYPIILEHSPEWARPFCIAFVVWSGDKFVYYFVVKYNVEIAIKAGVNWISDKIGIKR